MIFPKNLEIMIFPKNLEIMIFPKNLEIMIFPKNLDKCQTFLTNVKLNHFCQIIYVTTFYIKHLDKTFTLNR
jgi:glutathione peroxidase-family protein